MSEQGSADQELDRLGASSAPRMSYARGEQTAAASHPGQNLTNLTVGHFHIAERLGGGTMAAVYRAFDAELGRDIALKVLLPGADPVMRARFRQEARMVSTLVHPHIVPTLQVGETGDVIFIAMELVEGSSLGALLERHGKLDPGDACRLLAPIAQALYFAHAQGIVHRDVKPSNILLQRTDEVGAHGVMLGVLGHAVIPLLSDFGIARALDAPELTAVGRTIGTPAFMAPEQCAGSDDVDGRADIYALGAVLYRCLVGRAPFSGSTTQILHAHVYDPLLLPETSAADLPPAAVEILARAMMKEPEQRYASAAMMAQAFRTAIGTLPAEAVATEAVDATLTMASLPVTKPAAAATSRVLVPAAVALPRTQAQPAQPAQVPITPPRAVPTTAPNLLPPVVPQQSQVENQGRVARVTAPLPASRRRRRPGLWGLVALGGTLVVLMVILGALVANALLPTTGQEAGQEVGQANVNPMATSLAAAPVGLTTPTVGVAPSPPAQVTVAPPSVAPAAVATATVAAQMGATATPNGPTPTPTQAPPPAVPLASAWADAQAFFAERDWQSALDWLIMVRRIDEKFEQAQVETMLVRSYMALAGQVSLRGQWARALEYLDAALVLQPTNEVLVALHDATEALSVATAETRPVAREGLQAVVQRYAEMLATDGDLCGAAEEMDIAAKILVTTELVDRQAELSRACRELTALDAVTEVGGSILYSTQEGDAYTILRLPVGPNGSSVRLVNDAAQPRLGPNGRQLAFFNRQPGAGGLFGVDLAGGLSFDGRSVRYTGSLEDSQDSPPAWSPNGERLAFSSTRFGDGRYRIYITSADENAQTVELGYGKDPAWHPRQDLIAFNGTDLGGANPGLWLMRADGTGRVQLTDNGNDQRPAWSPDGRYLVFMSNGRDGNWELYRLDTTTLELMRLTDHAAQDGLPTFSPDGKWVAFMSDRDGYWRVWFVSIDGGTAAPLGNISGQLQSWLEHAIQWVP